MFFERMKDAKEYARDQQRMTGSSHKAVACKQWRCDRATGEYSLYQCYTVVMA